MSAVVIAGDIWKPSIVQLVPFSKANPCVQNTSNLKETVNSNGKRCFPILAVTRSQSGVSVDDSVVSVETYSSLAFSDYKSEISDTISSSRHSSAVSTKRDTKFRKSVRHSSMRESRGDLMVKFAIQDLNEQSGASPTRRNSVTSIDTGVSMTTISAASLSSNGLPKPTLADKKYLYKQNGFKKTLPFTPGEVELQKQREKYAKEQSQKSKKYKLNINQLPRSNTPITDHDPDKLNMKQVFRFLQKQKPVSTPRSETKLPKSPERRPSESIVKTIPSNYTVGEKIRSDLKTSDSIRSRGGEISIASRSKLVSRDSETASRASSLQSTRYHLSNKSDASRTLKTDLDKQETVEERRDRSKQSEHNKEKDRNRPSRKRVKEFKLHRFLALAPNGEGQKTNPLIISNITQVRTNNWVTMREGLKSEGCNKIKVESEERTYIRRVSSEKPSVLHYRALKRENTNGMVDRCDDRSKDTRLNRPSTETDVYYKGKTESVMPRSIRFQRVHLKDDISVADSDDGKMSTTNSSMIRLPSVHDYVEEEDDETTVHDSSKSDLERWSPIQISDTDIEQKRESNNSRSSVESSKSIYSMPTMSSSPRRGFMSKPKQSIHVSLPKEGEVNKEIRLSLRQEKGLTARHSYMSDIAPSRFPNPSKGFTPDNGDSQTLPNYSDTISNKHLVRISRVSMQSEHLENYGICDDTRVSPDTHVTSNSVGALTSR